MSPTPLPNLFGASTSPRSFSDALLFGIGASIFISRLFIAFYANPLPSTCTSLRKSLNPTPREATADSALFHLADAS